MDQLNTVGEPSNVKMRSALCFTMTLVILSFIPNIVGHNWQSGHCAILGLSIVVFAFMRNIKLDLKTVAVTLLPFFTLLITSAVIDSSSLIQNSIYFLYQAAGLILAIALVSTYSREEISYYFIQIHLFLAISICITYALIMLGFSQQIFLFEFEEKAYTGNLLVYFPFTIVGQIPYYILSFELPRTYGFYREPGLLQCFLATAWLFMLEDSTGSFKKKYILSIIFGISIICCLSTQGLFSLLYCLVYLSFTQFTRKKSIFYAVFGIMMLVVVIFLSQYFFNVEDIGFTSKIENASGVDRLKSVDLAVKVWNSNMWMGYGVNTYASKVMVDSWTGNIFCFFAYCGIIGISIHLFSMYYWISRIRHRNYFLLVPIVMTMIVSQPLAEAIGFWFIIMILNAKDKVIEEEYI